MPAWLPHPLRRAYWLAVDAAGYLLVGRPLNRLGAGLGIGKKAAKTGRPESAGKEAQVYRKREAADTGV